MAHRGHANDAAVYVRVQCSCSINTHTFISDKHRLYNDTAATPASNSDIYEMSPSRVIQRLEELMLSKQKLPQLYVGA
jgi:hypothetical protein